MAGAIHKKLREQVFQAAFVGKKETVCILFYPLNPESAVSRVANTPAFGNALVLFLSFSSTNGLVPTPDPNLQTPTFLAPVFLLQASPPFSNTP